jgi:Spy/CpxP family protein refolding chaperone
MARYLGWTLAVVLVCTPVVGLAASPTSAVDCGQDRGGQNPPVKGASDRGGPDRGPGNDHPRFKWWEDPKARAELGITDRQAAQIKEIFEPTMTQLKAQRTELDKREATLSQTIKDDRSDVTMVAQQVDRVENLRAEMQKTRVVMLFRIRRVLSAEQRKRLEAMIERIQAERRKNDPKRH